MLDDSKPINKLTKQDWIILRLLFYITSTDVSSATVKDVSKTMNYVNWHYGTGTVLKAFDLIRRDLVAHGEYDNPASAAMRAIVKNAEDAANKARKE